MIRIFSFDNKLKVKELDKVPKESFFQWIHITRRDNAEEFLMNLLKKDKEFIEDLLEQQRPNIINYDDFDVVVLSFPSKKSRPLQITFVISKKRIITIASRESNTLNNIMDNIKNIKVSGATNIFSLIVDRLIEKSVSVFHDIEDEIEEKEIKVLNNSLDKDLITEMNEKREYLFLITKMLRGDYEVIDEILNKKASRINLKYFGKHLRDRILYLLDYTDIIKESINNVNNMYITLLSKRMNESIYKLTIIGALMIIPTIIAGLFGMNVELPNLSFWQIVELILGLSVLASIILKLLF